MKNTFTLLFIICSTRLFSQSFGLDAGFAYQGTFGLPVSNAEMYWSVADNAGNVYYSAVKDTPASEPHICIGKLDASGNLLWQKFPQIGVRETWLAQIAVQPDGKVVGAGAVDVTSSTSSVLVVRYNADGTPDSTFGTDGVSITTLGRAWFATAIAVQADGKILVGCNGDSTGSTTILRFNTDGSTDNTFNATGKKVIDREQPWVTINSIRANSDGSILVGGYVIWYPPGAGLWCNQYAVVKLTTSGAYDVTFGGGDGAMLGAAVTTQNSYEDQALDLKVDSAGNIYQSGYTFFSNSPWTNGVLGIQRYKPNGDLDSTFGAAHSGVVSHGPMMRGGKIGLLTDGKILLAGSLVHNSGSAQPMLFRYFADGTLDSAFGGSNTGSFQYGYAGFYSVQSVFVQTDGKVLVTDPGSVSRFRYGTIGIADISSEGASLYPNPANGFVHIQIGDRSGNVSYQMINTVGEVVREGNLNSSNAVVDMSTLSTGMYLMRITSNNGIVSRKVIKD